MRNDTPDGAPAVHAADYLSDHEQAELVRITARMEELSHKARQAEERLYQTWATGVPLARLRHWRDSLYVPARLEPAVANVRDLIDAALQKGLQEAQTARDQAQGRAKLSALGEPGEHHGYVRSADL